MARSMPINEVKDLNKRLQLVCTQLGGVCSDTPEEDLDIKREQHPN